MTRELNLLYVHSKSLGYGRAGEYLAEELQRRDITVYDHLIGTDDPAAEHLNNGHNAGRSGLVCWISVPGHARKWWKGQHSAIVTMWEASRLPEAFRGTLHEFDTVIVPSQQNVELFSEYHDNVKLMHLGVDPRVWYYVPRKPPTDRFNFLIGGSGPRKGGDLAVKAFFKVFGKWNGKGPRPVLIQKSPKPADWDGGHPSLELIAGRIDAQTEVDLYASAHCYLQPSRGEGWGLQPHQAIAQGLPTILTDAHGHKAFAHLGYGLSTKMVEADYFSHGYAGQWWEPDFDQLCEFMRYVYDHYDAACAVAQDGARAVARDLTVVNMVDQFEDAVGEHMGPYVGPEEWHVAEEKKFLVRVLKPWIMESAGVRYEFHPGRDYYELADVKRSLFDIGMLDPSCLDDGGLTDAQIERMGAYTAANTHCYACGQQLNTGVTKADEEFMRLEALARAEGRP